MVFGENQLVEGMKVRGDAAMISSISAFENFIMSPEQLEEQRQRARP